ncbi:hypothetical protein M436DRAFT_67724 [Aureobasidium namibiae CBS 147.97]|uniref:Uncharacterized protein n=1 Tax=Aureobasidium namibiae CBS 147.97 TaxID=1043004 RepID=A0A074WB36_9PEZI|nr:uncharacterized protein M436DRAFT_67724 [Aureobasidium namibiae CBS 147.97]KEQ68804.1 hypothetical protein M436DRAFT_67724 [Aureobasidium namibiae CBS 147.97]
MLRISGHDMSLPETSLCVLTEPEDEKVGNHVVHTEEHYVWKALTGRPAYSSRENEEKMVVQRHFGEGELESGRAWARVKLRPATTHNSHNPDQIWRHGVTPRQLSTLKTQELGTTVMERSRVIIAACGAWQRLPRKVENRRTSHRSLNSPTYRRDIAITSHVLDSGVGTGVWSCRLLSAGTLGVREQLLDAVAKMSKLQKQAEWKVEGVAREAATAKFSTGAISFFLVHARILFHLQSRQLLTRELPLVQLHPLKHRLTAA